MTSEKYFEFLNHDGEYFLNEDTEIIFKGSHLRKLIFKGSAEPFHFRNECRKESDPI